MMQSASVPRRGGPDAMIPDKEAVLGASVGAVRANDFPRHRTNPDGRVELSLRTDPEMLNAI